MVHVQSWKVGQNAELVHTEIGNDQRIRMQGAEACACLVGKRGLAAQRRHHLHVREAQTRERAPEHGTRRQSVGVVVAEHNQPSATRQVFEKAAA